ncbi:MAG: ABC transporter ATP-binding protein [Gammaproteobacteria bacterium]|nr:ABC transporter ATP-binding protein [Gammaproteobacteria bacterium]NIR88862.1 ABC transporter ATP-binding protein [Gammaproteobacteria bacterium]NIU06466.1 ABC transporter ATP-binding protein [Gammaproteobacteria bacterium]NIV53358.1 ATP-binding cassette domain-containing protein [Gammaproteobacteria bacterium]NIV74077.1 ATP-binding cassette domain-containing protein [Gammaproteobacteria bacterium]
MTSAQAELRVLDVSKSFGGLTAVDRCSFHTWGVGTITGVIGPNGAGKSTLFDIISGLTRADGGEIWLRGRRIDTLPPYQVARLGVARTFQTPREIRRLTLLENLMLVPLRQRGELLRALIGQGRRIRTEERAITDQAEAVLELVEMTHQRDTPAGSLSIGQKKLLELARCLMARPVIVLLDEPAAGVNPRLLAELLKVIENIARSGVTLIIIEHNINLIMSLCSHVVVLHHGHVLCEGTPESVQKDERVLEAYLGAAV